MIIFRSSGTANRRELDGEDVPKQRNFLFTLFVRIGVFHLHPLENFSYGVKIAACDSRATVCRPLLCRLTRKNFERHQLVSSCLCVRPYETTRLPLGTFSRHLITSINTKIYVENSVQLKIEPKKRDTKLFQSISLSVPLHCREHAWVAMETKPWAAPFISFTDEISGRDSHVTLQVHFVSS
jgi:hypothetical protein